MPSSDWSFCKLALAQHSRTFAIPIAMLQTPLEQGVTAAYLLCRIADTVEDNPEASASDRERLFRLLLDVMDGSRDCAEFVDACASVAGFTSNELHLMAGLPRVLNVFREAPGHEDAGRWIAELIRGMAIYAQRKPDISDGIMALTTLSDLDRYCYFVAGAIGHLLSELFSAQLALSTSARLHLQQFAEGFGRGLQLVNILRDMSTDLQRKVCFVPRAELARWDLTPSDIVNPACALRVRNALEPLFQLAERSLAEALEYVLAIPAQARDVRSFCLVPLWLAVATLRQCQADERLLNPSERVKLSRSQVGALITECTALAGDEAALRRAFGKLQAWEPVVAA
jgi:phytoene/squalene synthetase